MNTQHISNPHNQGGTSITQPLLQVVMLIDSNGCVQSFTTAHMHLTSMLRFGNGAIQAVPTYQ
jgi:hypothetical protein